MSLDGAGLTCRLSRLRSKIWKCHHNSGSFYPAMLIAQRARSRSRAHRHVGSWAVADLPRAAGGGPLVTQSGPAADWLDKCSISDNDWALASRPRLIFQHQLNSRSLHSGRTEMEEKQASMERFVEFINTVSEKLADELISPKAIFHVPGSSRAGSRDPPGYIEIIEMMRRAFPTSSDSGGNDRRRR